jgi:8-oxo-dGTP pyrophosphatase MutT (NUDIX family)
MFNLPKWKPEFSKLEESILQYWKENKTFEKSVDSRPAENPYRFYDGPPFITGTPHYGSLLSSIIKDVVPRYQTMLGKRVERVWGWDCHGLPIEQKVQKKMWLESNKEIEESEGGIQKFIDECYNYTRDTSSEWGWYIDHIGRWVDMDNAYRTMDQNYMESVMWVFKQIWEKGYIYEGKRVSWYSWKLSTPISNFEIAMDDSYQDVQDPAITVKFPIKEVKKGAGAIIRDEEGKLLMIRNKKDGLWRIPGGHVEEGESYHDAAARELIEETGISCKLESAYNSTYHTYRGAFYECGALFAVQCLSVRKLFWKRRSIQNMHIFALDALPVRSEIHYGTWLWAFWFSNRRSWTSCIVPDFMNARTVSISCLDDDAMDDAYAYGTRSEQGYYNMSQVLSYAEIVYPCSSFRVETVFKGKGDYQIIWYHERWRARWTSL